MSEQTHEKFLRSRSRPETEAKGGRPPELRLASSDDAFPKAEGQAQQAPASDPLPAEPVGEDGGGHHVPPELGRARKLVLEGRLGEARTLYRGLVSDHPRDVTLRMELGAVHHGLGQYSMAAAQFEAARDLSPGNAEALNRLGEALTELGNHSEAERELQRAHRLAPGSAEIRANLGILFFRRGLYAEAERDLRWVCEHDPEHGPAHFYRGEALNRLGRVEAALEVLERTTRLQPDNARAYYLMGLLYDRSHLPDEAEAMFRKARELWNR